MPDPDIHDRRPYSRYDDDAYVQDCLNVIAYERQVYERRKQEEATRAGRLSGSDLTGYDADRDDNGAWPKHLEDWENERLRNG